MYRAAVVQQRGPGEEGRAAVERRGAPGPGEGRRRLSPQAAAGEGKGPGPRGEGKGPQARARPPLDVSSGDPVMAGAAYRSSSPHPAGPVSSHAPGPRCPGLPAAVGPQRGTEPEPPTPMAAGAGLR